jgi:hypothetical protein
MPEPALSANAERAESVRKSRGAVGLRSFNPRAVFRGMAVAAAGALVMSTLVGVTAVVSMANDGLSLETIAEQLRAKWDLQLFTAAGELLMAALGGYTAAISAGRGHIRHALAAGTAALAVDLVIIAICGSPLAPWLAVASLSLVVPCAAVGGYLASPRIEPHASTLST